MGTEMRHVPRRKVTIVAEALLEDRIVRELRGLGARGFTIADVRGQGSRGVRAGDWEGRNVRIETIVSDEVAERVLEHVATQYFANYAVIAWVDEVEVVRGDKYG
jgi:nitrogen regulatory protein PII